jgi:hypothetical protein
VFPDHLICIDCGAEMKMLKRHLRTEHNLSAEEYRARWGLPADYPIVASNYAKQRSKLAKAIGLRTRPRMKRSYPFGRSDGAPILRGLNRRNRIQRSMAHASCSWCWRSCSTPDRSTSAGHANRAAALVAGIWGWND